MGGGREEGLAKEGGAVGVPSAQAPRGAGGVGWAGPGSVRHLLQLLPPLHCVCWLLGRLFLGRLGNLVWAPADNWQ